MANNASEHRKYEMPSHLRLGFDKNGNIDIENWEREFETKASGFFKDLVECFRDNNPRTWMDKDARFIYYKTIKDADGNIRKERSKFPSVKDEDYDDAAEDRDIWRDKKKRFLENAPSIITFMLDGTMCNESRERLMRAIASGTSTTLKEIRENNDILRLKQEIINVHDYQGIQIEKSDLDQAEKAMVDLKVSKFKPGYTVAEHKRNYDEIVRKLTSFKMIGNKDARDDRFNQKYLFADFVDPMETHESQRIQNRCQEIENGTAMTADGTKRVDKNDPASIQLEYIEFTRL